MKSNCSEIVSRYFNTFTILHKKNHYDALGLTPQATQGQIKSAYYKLSKVHHPDKNKGSEDSNNKFRSITAAYEVLGNNKSRKLYDRGLSGGLSDSGLKYWGGQSHQKVRETKGTRIQTSKVYSGRTPIYDFDEWARAHYSETFQRKAYAKAQYQENLKNNNNGRIFMRNEIIVLVITLTILSAAVSFTYSTSLDIPLAKREDTPPRKTEI